MTRSLLATAAVITVSAAMSAIAAPGQARPPSFAGTWELDSMIGAAPFAFPHGRSVCGPGGAPVPSGRADRSAEAPDGSTGEQVSATGETFTATLAILQTDTTLTIERVFGGSMAKGSFNGTYSPGGTEEVNESGGLVSRTRSRWEGARLVIEGHVELKRGERRVICTVTETFETSAGGELLVLGTGEVNGLRRTSRQTYYRRREG